MIQKIKFTDGCPNGCLYCYEPKVEPKYYYPNWDKSSKDLIQILDMNFLSNPQALIILKALPKAKYEFVCGIDYRILTQEIADLMKEKGFIKVRWAWDYNFSLQKKQQKTWKMFRKAGYRNESLSVFMIVNWKIPFIECCMKLDLLKVWNVKVNDCCYNGGYKIAKPIYWTPEQIKKFRLMCRKHNQMILFKIDPQYKGGWLYK